MNASGNYALLDIVAALHWIRDNIAAFGGDPAKVTIGGQSAGAGNTHNMVASPLAKGLFRGAIAESGSSYGPGNARRLAEAEPMGVKFAEAKGAHSLAELRKMPWQKIFEPVQGATFGAVVDGYVLPASPSETFAQGRQNDVPTLTGGNRHDNNGSVPHPTVTAARVRRAVEAEVRRTGRRVPEAVPGGDRRSGARVPERVAAGQHADVAVSVGDAPREDGEDGRVGLLLGPRAAWTGCRALRRVPHLRSAVRDGDASTGRWIGR